MKAWLSAKISLSLLLCSSVAHSYPTTIAHGYKTCMTCHLTGSGGSVLGGYGRAMSSDFMSTFDIGKPHEFFMSDSEDFEVGLNYRHLALNSQENELTQFPMLLDADIAYYLPSLAIAASVGMYSRERTIESRENYALFYLSDQSTVRAGYFMPVFGINTNDHSLQIKKIAGLGRGSESYNLEFWYLTEWFQYYLTLSAPEFHLRSDDQYNFYRATIPNNSQTIRTRLSLFKIPRFEAGGSYLYNFNYSVNGVFLKWSPATDIYTLFEYDTDEEATASYFRAGYFYFRGVDMYYEYDNVSRESGRILSHYLGIDWMIIPRVELSLKINLGDGYDQYQSHLWY